MRTLFKKFDPKEIDDLPKGVDILFIIRRDIHIVDSYVGTVKQVKAFRQYHIDNEYTHYLILPKFK